MKNKSIVLFSLVAFSAILVLASVIFIIVFIINFWGVPLSSNMTDWGEFGSYISCITSLLNLVFFVVLTQKASDFEKTSSEKQSSFQQSTFNQQMLSHKVELETSFRKSHIDDIRKIMFEFSTLTSYNLQKEDGFKQFKRECESLKLVFEIYEANKNEDLFGECSYNHINDHFKTLMTIIDSIKGNHVTTETQIDDIWSVLDRINSEIINLEKTLSDYTLNKLKNAFNGIK